MVENNSGGIVGRRRAWKELGRSWKDLGRRSNGNSKFSTFLKAALDKGHRNSKLICRKLFNKAISANTSRVVSYTNIYFLIKISRPRQIPPKHKKLNPVLNVKRMIQVSISQGEINYETQTDGRERANINSKHQMIFSKLDYLRKLKIKAMKLFIGIY